MTVASLSFHPCPVFFCCIFYLVLQLLPVRIMGQTRAHSVFVVAGWGGAGAEEGEFGCKLELIQNRTKAKEIKAKRKSRGHIKTACRLNAEVIRKQLRAPHRLLQPSFADFFLCPKSEPKTRNGQSVGNSRTAFLAAKKFAAARFSEAHVHKRPPPLWLHRQSNSLSKQLVFLKRKITYGYTFLAAFSW